MSDDTPDPKNAFMRGLYYGYARTDDADSWPGQWPTGSSILSGLDAARAARTPEADVPGVHVYDTRALKDYARADVTATMQMLGLVFRDDTPKPPPEPDPPHIVLARHVGSAFWRIGYTVSQVGRFIEDLGDRVIDLGDELAQRIADR